MPTLNRTNTAYMGNENLAEVISRSLDQERTTQNEASTEVLPNIKIDCDVLFLGDSNLNQMRTEIMDYGTKCEKIKCVLLSDIVNLLDKAEIKRVVKSVYMQCGTNNLDHDSAERVKILVIPRSFVIIFFYYKLC